MIPQELIDDLVRANSFYRVLKQEHRDDLKSGCSDCSPKNYECLRSLISALNDKVSLDEYDDVVIKLYEQMLLIIGDFTTQVAPTVDAGSNQSQPLGGEAEFYADITVGSSPIASILWTQISGTPAVLNGATTDTLTVTGYSSGQAVFKVLVTDENGLTGSDTATLTGQVASLVGYWWLSDEGDAPLTQSEIEEQNEFNFADGGDLTIPFTGVVFKQLNMAYPNSQTSKTDYVNVDNDSDFGILGASLMTTAITTGIFKQHNGLYVVNGNRTLKFS